MGAVKTSGKCLETVVCVLVLPVFCQICCVVCWAPHCSISCIWPGLCPLPSLDRLPQMYFQALPCFSLSTKTSCRELALSDLYWTNTIWAHLSHWSIVPLKPNTLTQVSWLCNRHSSASIQMEDRVEPRTFSVNTLHFSTRTWGPVTNILWWM